MHHRTKGKILGREKAPREMMLRNLAASIIIHEKVKTTEAKAKTVKVLVEKLITTSKAKDLNARRKLLETLPQTLAVSKAMDVLADRYKERPGGYTRIVKLGSRVGDGAAMVQIELV
jgi:large subunit ribosomal protein L17